MTSIKHEIINLSETIQKYNSIAFNNKNFMEFLLNVCCNIEKEINKFKTISMENIII